MSIGFIVQLRHVLIINIGRKIWTRSSVGLPMIHHSDVDIFIVSKSNH